MALHQLIYANCVPYFCFNKFFNCKRSLIDEVRMIVCTTSFFKLVNINYHDQGSNIKSGIQIVNVAPTSNNVIFYID